MPADNIFEPVSGNVPLEELMKTIREDVPRSAVIHNMILMHSKGYTDSFSIYTQKSSPGSILLVEKSDNGIISVYCPESNEEDFVDALSKTTLIIWPIFNCALFVPETICEKLSLLIINKTHAEVFIKEGEFYIYDPKEDTMELEIPAGYTLRKLGNASAIQMEAVGEPLFVCPNLNKFRELHITAPNCTVYRTEEEPNKVINFDLNDLPEAVEEGIPLAWACCNKEGQLGLVCTNEEEILKIIESKKDLDHLEKKLTQLVVNACTLRMVKEGFIAHSNVYHGLSELPYMSNWRLVGYICSIYSRFTDSSTDDNDSGTDADRMGTSNDLEEAGGDDRIDVGNDNLGGADEEELGGADEEELGGTDEEKLGGTDEEELGGADEEELGGADEEELEGTDEKLGGTDDEELEGIDEVLGGIDGEELAGTDDEEQYKTDNEELCGTDEEELVGTDVEVGDTDVEQVETEKDLKGAKNKEDDVD